MALANENIPRHPVTKRHNVLLRIPEPVGSNLDRDLLNSHFNLSIFLSVCLASYGSTALMDLAAFWVS
jgi:hypothetical protein